MGGENKISEIRQDVSFANYEPQTQEQAEGLALAQAIAKGLIEGNGKFKSILAQLESPLPNGHLFCFSGAPGRGKTHLMEAIINEVRASAPNVYGSMTFQRGDLPRPALGSIPEHEVDWKPIIFLDDVWADKHSVDDLIENDIRNISELIKFAYDRKLFVVMSTNFPFTKDVLPKIQEWDKVGRISSRAAEMLKTRSQEIEIIGPDHRQEMAAEAPMDINAGFFGEPDTP